VNLLALGFPVSFGIHARLWAAFPFGSAQCSRIPEESLASGFPHRLIELRAVCRNVEVSLLPQLQLLQHKWHVLQGHVSTRLFFLFNSMLKDFWLLDEYLLTAHFLLRGELVFKVLIWEHLLQFSDLVWGKPYPVFSFM